VKTPFSAVVLAGGQSTRMGRPKATLEFSGIPLWLRQVALAQSLGTRDIMVSCGPDWSPEKGPWKVVSDLVPGKGPLGGLQAALDAMSTEWLLVLAVDMPDMTQDFLERLAALAQPRGVVPVVDGWYQGLAAIYPRMIRGIVDEAVGGEDRSLQALVSRALGMGLVDAMPVADADRLLFRNLNRPEDL
jgi:molybdopterin-guanine dinucleotide biosynthesis protein A